MLESAQKKASSILTAIGKKFGIDAHYFAKNSLYVLINHFVNMLKGIVTVYLVTRIFSQEMYGAYKFVVGMVGTIGVFAISGMQPAISRAIARGDKEAPVRFTLALYTGFCAVGAAAILVSIAFLPYWHQEKLWPLFLLAAALFIPTNVATMFFGSIVIGLGKFRISFGANLLSSLLITVSVFAMLLIHPSAALLFGLTAGIPALIYLILLRSMVTKYPSKKRDWSIFRYAWRITLADIPVSLSWYIDGLLISALFGLKELAIFSVATLIPEAGKVLCKEFLPISFAKQAAGKDTWHRRRHLIKAVGLMTIVFGLGIAFYIALAPWTMALIFPKYDTAQLVRLTDVSALILITFPASLFAQHLEARGMAKDLLIAQWLSSAIFVVALLFFVPPYGALGALIARGLFRLTLALYSFGVLYLRPTQE